MELFSGNEVSIYTAAKYKEMEKEIQAISDQKIASSDLDEWADYLLSKYYIDPIVLFEDNIEQTIAETKIKQRNVWYKYGSYEPEYYDVEGYCITFKIPFDGDYNLLYLQPPTRILTRFPVSSVSDPRGEELGYIDITINNTAADMKSHLDDIEAFVSGQFEGTFKHYRQMIGYINEGIRSFNSGLRQSARNLLQKRKEKAIDFDSISRALKIPLKMRDNAPSTVPVPLKRVPRKQTAKPPFRAPDPEYCISDEDYANILNIIHSSCISMEATARTFVKNDEEELRDFIIATLGTHYENAVTGETFRKTGKTDIQVMFNNRAAFIGECKIWHGIKRFADAIDQLFGYSTWKDSKTALIVFNKDNKDFSSIRKTVEQWISSNTKMHNMRNGNMWECILHRNDTNTDCKLAIALYDLTI